MKLAHTLITLGESYGQQSTKGKEILNIPFKDLAEVTEIGVEEATKIMEKLHEKGWIMIDRRKAEGIGQEAGGRNIIFALCQKGRKPLNLFMKKVKGFFSRRASARKKVSLSNLLHDKCTLHLLNVGNYS